MTTIDNNILRVFKPKSYLVILQGSSGSGKTPFASELKRYFEEIDSQPRHFEICSIDEYYQDQSIEYSKATLSDAYHFCKSKIKTCIRNGTSIIYNNKNLDDEYLTDIVQCAKENKFCAIILRFFPQWNEEKSVEIAKYFHPLTESQTTKGTIISENVKMLNFQNKHKMGVFGVTTRLEQNDKIIFVSNQQIDATMKNLKREYIEKKHISDKPQKQKKIIPMQQPTLCPSPIQLPPQFQVPPSIQLKLIGQQHKISSLEKEVEDLQRRLSDLTCGAPHVRFERKRCREFNNTPESDLSHDSASNS
jgi:hypothetical protein